MLKTVFKGLGALLAVALLAAAVFVVSGYPDGGGIDDEPLNGLLTENASQLQHSSVLMLNTTNDHIFSTAGVHELFGAVQADGKQLSFWEGGHNDWPEEMIAASASFIDNRLADTPP